MADCLQSGVALHRAGRLNEAEQAYLQVLRAQPQTFDALHLLGVVYLRRKQYDASIALIRSALLINPDHAGAYYNLGNAFQYLQRMDDAVACYHRTITLNPAHVEAYHNLGTALRAQRRFDDAGACYRHVLQLMPEHDDALGLLADTQLKSCNWTAMVRTRQALLSRLAQGEAVISPFSLLGFSDDPALQLACTQLYLPHKIGVMPAPLWTGQRYTHDKIRIAYLSADFHQHATAYLMAELFELHDRAQFEVIGVSFGPDDGSAIRCRLQAAFDRFIDVRFTSDADVAAMLHTMEIDIAIDLKGHTQDARPGILAYHPAPVQVNYLGYPGTMGADFIDYIIADRWSVPFDQQAFYTEKIVHLPDCYQVNDSRRAIADATPGRADCGLPERGFVFCCFNNNYKITPDLFAIWMRLLKTVPGSVLWLLQDNAAAQRNLLQEAQVRGIAAERLVFAGRLPLDQHLARHRLADLFLDTLPINAHTTASDALWAGLPVLTCIGRSFAGRVAASLLHALGLPELVAAGLPQYEALALRLATQPTLLKNVKEKLLRNRQHSALFDTVRYTRHLESAYRVMHDAARHGHAPHSFAVDPISPQP